MLLKLTTEREDLLELRHMHQLYQRLCKEHPNTAAQIFRALTDCDKEEAEGFCVGCSLTFQGDRIERTSLITSLTMYAGGWYDGQTAATR